MTVDNRDNDAARRHAARHAARRHFRSHGSWRLCEKTACGIEFETPSNPPVWQILFCCCVVPRARTCCCGCSLRFAVRIIAFSFFFFSMLRLVEQAAIIEHEEDEMDHDRRRRMLSVSIPGLRQLPAWYLPRGRSVWRSVSHDEPVGNEEEKRRTARREKAALTLPTRTPLSYTSASPNHASSFFGCRRKRRTSVAPRRSARRVF